MVSFKAMVLSLAASAVVAQAQAGQATCGGGSKCPSDSPCCSSYGQCGVGAYCLGGCDPQNSFDLQSCMPAPVCKSADYKMDSLDDIVPNSQYLGNSSQGNWVSSGTPVPYNDDSILLTMAPSTVGTLLSSTHYVWYGKISATMTTSLGAGVVTAFILMSDVKDEIDFEFVGVDLQHAQSNYYFQGITDYDNAANLSASDTHQNVHTYTIDWQPDYVSWAVDGQVLRTKNRNETYNETTGQYHFPQSPSRVQLSLWPAGLQSNGEGTIGWAGGLVNWDNTTAMANGYYYAMVSDVNVECYNPPAGYNNQGTQAYDYTSTYGTNDTVAIVNKNTILASFQATGDNQQYCPNCVSSQSAGQAKTSAAPSSTPSAQANTVPGVSGAGAYSQSGGADAAAAGSVASGSGSSGSSDTNSNAAGQQGGGSTSFSQGLVASTNEGARMVAGSLVALVAFFAAAMIM